MNSRLRHIAVYVDEPSEKDFRWVLQERGADGQWSKLDSADSGNPTYKDAMADGLLHLQSLVANLDAGPRRKDTAATASHGRTKVPKSSVSESVDPSKTSVFGFGLAN